MTNSRVIILGLVVTLMPAVAYNLFTAPSFAAATPPMWQQAKISSPWYRKNVLSTSKPSRSWSSAASSAQAAMSAQGYKNYQQVPEDKLQKYWSDNKIKFISLHDQMVSSAMAKIATSEVFKADAQQSAAPVVNLLLAGKPVPQQTNVLASRAPFLAALQKQGNLFKQMHQLWTGMIKPVFGVADLSKEAVLQLPTYVYLSALFSTIVNEPVEAENCGHLVKEKMLFDYLYNIGTNPEVSKLALQKLTESIGCLDQKMVNFLDDRMSTAFILTNKMVKALRPSYAISFETRALTDLAPILVNLNARTRRYGVMAPSKYLIDLYVKHLNTTAGFEELNGLTPSALYLVTPKKEAKEVLLCHPDYSTDPCALLPTWTGPTPDVKGTGPKTPAGIWYSQMQSFCTNPAKNHPKLWPNTPGIGSMNWRNFINVFANAVWQGLGTGSVWDYDRIGQPYCILPSVENLSYSLSSDSQSSGDSYTCYCNTACLSACGGNGSCDPKGSQKIYCNDKKLCAQGPKCKEYISECLKDCPAKTGMNDRSPEFFRKLKQLSRQIENLLIPAAYADDVYPCEGLAGDCLEVCKINLALNDPANGTADEKWNAATLAKFAEELQKLSCENNSGGLTSSSDDKKKCFDSCKDPGLPSYPEWASFLEDIKSGQCVVPNKLVSNNGKLLCLPGTPCSCAANIFLDKVIDESKACNAKCTAKFGPLYPPDEQKFKECADWIDSGLYADWKNNFGTTQDKPESTGTNPKLATAFREDGAKKFEAIFLATAQWLGYLLDIKFTQTEIEHAKINAGAILTNATPCAGKKLDYTTQNGLAAVESNLSICWNPNILNNMFASVAADTGAHEAVHAAFDILLAEKGVSITHFANITSLKKFGVKEPEESTSSGEYIDHLVIQTIYDTMAYSPSNIGEYGYNLDALKPEVCL